MNKIDTGQMSDYLGLLADNTTNEQFRERLIPFVQIADLSYLLFEKDRKKTMAWLMAPNHIFLTHPHSKWQWGGRAEAVIEKLEEWSRKQVNS